MSERLRLYLDVYRAQLRATIAIQLQYRVSLVIWLVYTLLDPIISLTIWSTVARSTGGQVVGFSPADLAAYFLATMWVGHLTFTWVMHEMEFRVRQGQFSPKLLRPIHPIHADIAENLSYKVLTLLVLVPATALLVLLFQPRWEPAGWALGLFPLVLLLAFIIRFVTGWTLALVAFWITRVNAANQLFFAVMLFFSGQAFPLTFLPSALQTVTWLLPFRWTVSFPVELLLGRIDPTDAAVGIAMQVLWAVLALLVWHTVWRAAVRQYTAVGA